jgi:hypothetical protein
MQATYSLFIYLTVFVCASVVKNCVGADATGLSPGVYKEGADDKFHAVTNIDLQTLWPGVWKEDTNGLRVQLLLITNSRPELVIVGVGSVRFNSLGGYVGTPNLVFPKFELADTNGIAIPFINGKSIEKSLPSRLSINDFPRWPDGGLKSHIGFFTNGGPFNLSNFNLNNLYNIPRADDYVLTVCPAIYKFGTNINYLELVNLPCVTTKIHLAPN